MCLSDQIQLLVSVVDSLHSLQMTQNMFQEGLYQVFFKSSPPAPRQVTQVSNQGELVDVRIHRWFGTVVSARLLVAGVRRLPPLVSVPTGRAAAKVLRVSLSAGDADPWRRRLLARHSHACLCELRLRRRPLVTCVVQHLCESLICTSPATADSSLIINNSLRAPAVLCNRRFCP